MLSRKFWCKLLKKVIRHFSIVLIQCLPYSSQSCVSSQSFFATVCASKDIYKADPGRSDLSSQNVATSAFGEY